MRTHQEPKRFCVPCLKDERRTFAVTVVDGRGYCENHKDEVPTPAARQYKRLGPEARAAIAGRPHIPATVLAREYGVSDQTIANIRKEMAEEKVEAVAKSPQSTPTERVLLDALQTDGEEAFGPRTSARLVGLNEPPEPEPEPEPTQPEPGPTPKVQVSLELEVTEALADAIWMELPLEEKASVIKALMVERWRILAVGR